MKRRMITTSENVQSGAYKVNIIPEHIKDTKFRDVSLVDTFYIHEEERADGSKSNTYIDPIYMLFNQERLNQVLGSDNVQTWLKSLENLKSNPLNELKAKCSDEDLMSMIKSRHLQQPCEILAWARYMQANIDEFTENVRNLVAEKQAAEEAAKQQTNVEPQNVS